MKQRTEFYKRYKEMLKSKCIGIVNGTKCNLFDLKLEGIKNDEYHKLIFPNDKLNVYILIDKMKEQRANRLIKSTYHLIFVNEDYEGFKDTVIKLN